MKDSIEMPWDYSPIATPEKGKPNLPTPEGRAVGDVIAMIADKDIARMKERFPDAFCCQR